VGPFSRPRWTSSRGVVAQQSISIAAMLFPKAWTGLAVAPEWCPLPSMLAVCWFTMWGPHLSSARGTRGTFGALSVLAFSSENSQNWNDLRIARKSK